jgi:hypothetical protein
MTNPTGKGGFQRGQSGNPGGRPKLPGEMREMFQARAPEAFEVLTRHLQSSDPRIAITAASAILDRAYGKPAQPIDANVTSRFDHLSDEQIVARLDQLEAMSAPTNGITGGDKPTKASLVAGDRTIAE